MSEAGYSGTKAATIVGITYRQLDYWARTGLVSPSIREAGGSGTQRLYSFQDLVQLRMIKNLLDTDPPFTAHATDFVSGAGWDPRVGDPRGRAFVLSASYKF